MSGTESAENAPSSNELLPAAMESPSEPSAGHQLQAAIETSTAQTEVAGNKLSAAATESAPVVTTKFATIYLQFIADALTLYTILQMIHC